MSSIDRTGRAPELAPHALRGIVGERVRYLGGDAPEYGYIIASWPICGAPDGQLDCRVVLWPEPPTGERDPGQPGVFRYYLTSLRPGWGDGGAS